MRGCVEFITCPSTSACTNDSTVPSGYTCDQCMPGFEIIEAAGKCIGKIELFISRCDIYRNLLPS